MADNKQLPSPRRIQEDRTGGSPLPKPSPVPLRRPAPTQKKG